MVSGVRKDRSRWFHRRSRTCIVLKLLSTSTHIFYVSVRAFNNDGRYLKLSENREDGVAMTSTTKKKSASAKEKIEYEEPDYSLNDVMLRGRVSDIAIEKVLPSGDKVVEFRLIVSRLELSGVDTLDIAAWSAKSRRSALSLKPDEWIEISGAIHRRFWKAPTGLASRWQVEAAEISRI
jgi:single-strand DNA-binding protein